MNRIRCAIYTRKSSEEGLEQEFNSLDAQREACAAFITSQRAEGWLALETHYDDGGLSGGTLDRPALQRLMADIDAGLVDRIVVYKIDRLTRSLADFAKIVDRLDAAGTSFVSVTQSFNTATSMGRLTLNMLLSFAQFEREVTAERIRDKIAASKRKGLWMGGRVPLGYAPEGRTLRIREDEAAVIRRLYALYQEIGTLTGVRDAAAKLGIMTRAKPGAAHGNPFTRGHIHHLLTNPLYAGRIRHRDKVHEGQHPAIIDPADWDRMQGLLQAEAHKPRGAGSVLPCAPLKGKLFDAQGQRLTPSHTKASSGKRIRYYTSGPNVPAEDRWRLSAPEIEQAVETAVKQRLNGPEILAALGCDDLGMLQSQRRELDAFLEAAKPDQVLALVDRLDLGMTGVSIKLVGAKLTEATNLALSEDALNCSLPMDLQKRSTGQTMVFGDAAPDPDTTLITNIAKAHAWLDRIKAGETYDQIATADGTSKRRVQQMLDLAFLAPDIVRSICEGKQPARLTSEWFKTHRLPADWTAQRALIATL